jgi:para-aminobenzoate synthetase / 4-amino-4-deoxychorismate lyase
MIPPGDIPFVLLDDARLEGAAPARLYTAPLQIVATRKPEEVMAALDAIRLATQGGLHAAGYLNYEAGYAFEPKLVDYAPASADAPLLWFGLFRDYDIIDACNVPNMLPDPAGGWIGSPQPQISQADYHDRLSRILSLIQAGDIYQANLTFRAFASFVGDPLALYAGLRQRARAGYGAIVRTAKSTHLSLSPELFFASADGQVWTRPMKGTLPRSADPRQLLDDEKQRAENLMIVDLLRNDLSRVAVPGSVAVPELFRIETYPTLYQMTSLVTAELPPTRDAVDVLHALYPCGSITGAPKMRAMELIHAIEAAPRGIYTGAIGRIDAGGRDSAFNVAIRTLTLGQGVAGQGVAGQGVASLGLGSGIVADSVAQAEWEECLAKGVFIASDRRFDLIETMAFDPRDGIVLLETHLERMKSSAEVLGFLFNRHAARNELQAATFRLRDATRIRLVLGRSGAMAIATSPMPVPPPAPVSVALVSVTTRAADFRRAHKTSDRDFYDSPRAEAGTFEIVFVDADGFVTEGSFTSIFVQRDDLLLTPPTVRGLLPGVLRQHLIATGRAKESDLRAKDLKDGFFVGNALRGLLPARLQKL